MSDLIEKFRNQQHERITVQDIKEAAKLIEQLQQRNVELLRGNDQLGSKVEELEQREADLESKVERLECELEDQLPNNSGVASDAYFHCQDMIIPYLGNELSDTTLINSVCGSLEFLIEQWQLNKGIKQERDELAAHVDRLHCEFDKGSGDPSILWEILEASPTTSLNAVRRAENIKGARELANMIALPIAHVNADQYESIVNQRYPDKE